MDGYDDGIEACEDYFSGERVEKCKKSVRDGDAFVMSRIRFDVEHDEQVPYDGNPDQPARDISLDDVDPSGAEPFVFATTTVTPDGQVRRKDL